MSTVKLKKRANKNGPTTLFLRINDKGELRYEFLSHLQLKKPSNAFDRTAQ